MVEDKYSEKSSDPSEIFLSIVIPVYNVQEYLPKCVDAVLAQGTNVSFEILLIDDGSSDGSGSLCDDYANRFSNVSVIHKENGGASSARNVGIRFARGRYLFFVDSDDFINENAFEQIGNALNSQPDLLLVNITRIIEDKKTVVSPWNAKALEKGHDYFISRIISKDPMLAMPQTGIVRKQLLTDYQLCFTEGIIHEDMEWIPKLICAASTIEVLEEPVYNYIALRSGSVMNQTNVEKHINSLVVVAKKLAIFADDLVECRKIFILRAAALAVFMALGYANKISDTRLDEVVKEIQSNSQFDGILAYMPLKYRICCFSGGMARGRRLYDRLFSK